MGLDNLQDHRQPKAGALLVGGEIGFENFPALFGRHTGTVVTNLEARLGPAGSPGGKQDVSVLAHGLKGVQQEVKQRLPQQLLVGFDGQWLTFNRDVDFLFLEIITQGPHDFVDGGRQRETGAPDLARAGVVDEFVQLHRDLVGLLHDGA